MKTTEFLVVEFQPKPLPPAQGKPPAQLLLQYVDERKGDEVPQRLWTVSRPQLRVVNQRLRVVERAGGVLEVIVGDMLCGTMQRLRGLSFDFGGKKFPLKVFHHKDNRDPVVGDSGFLGALHLVAEADEVYVVGKPEAPRLFIEMGQALMGHLSMVQVSAGRYVWPDGTVVDAY